MTSAPFWTRPRRRRFAVAILAGAAIGFVALLATSRGLTTIRGGRIGGDLPAFYGAARILRSGEADRLYDARAQEEAEVGLLPEGTSGRLPFPYPPFVAFAYLPLTWLPFKLAYAVHAAVMTLCVVWAIALVRPLVPQLKDEFLPVLAATLAAYPMFRAILGGQNTPLSLLCAAGAAAALANGRDLTAGLWIGAWLFKPQFALPVGVMLMVRARNRRSFLIGLCAVGAAYYLIAAAIAGWGWPIWWYREGATAFAVADLVADRANGISFAELAAPFHLVPVSWIASALLAGIALRMAWLGRHPLAVTAFALGTAVLIAPHALYYDGGLAAMALIATAAWRPSTIPAVAAIWLLAWVQPLRPVLPLPPVTAGILLSLYLVYRVRENGMNRPGASEAAARATEPA